MNIPKNASGTPMISTSITNAIARQVRMCRLVPQVLHPDGTQIREIRVAPVPEEKSAVRIDYAAQEPGSVNRAHFATCVFGGATFERDRLDLTALETDQGPLGAARL